MEYYSLCDIVRYGDVPWLGAVGAKETGGGGDNSLAKSFSSSSSIHFLAYSKDQTILLFAIPFIDFNLFSLYSCPCLCQVFALIILYKTLSEAQRNHGLTS